MKKQYAGYESDNVRGLKQVLEKNARLKKLVTELSLNKAVLQDVLAKNITATASDELVFPPANIAQQTGQTEGFA